MKYGAAFGTTLNWGHATVAQPGCGGRHIRCTRGRGVGGCSLVNGMLYNRGAREIYDTWGADSGSGGPTWSAEACLPYFKAHEDNSRGASAWHGAGGEVRIADIPTQNLSPIATAFREASVQAGHADNGDQNSLDPSRSQLGVQVYQCFVDERKGDGRRVTASRAFLAQGGATFGELTLESNCTAAEIVLSDAEEQEREGRAGLRARGVRYLREDGSAVTAMAGREVVLSAGVIGSPQLLQLSGIGPASVFRSPPPEAAAAAAEGGWRWPRCQLELEAVGEHLVDHPRVACRWESRLPGLDLSDCFSHVEGNLYARSSLAQAAAAQGSEPVLAVPDIQIQQDHVRTNDDMLSTPPLSTGFNLKPHVAQPRSSGTVRLASADPAAKPRIDPRYLSDAEGRDLRCLVEGVQLARAVVAQPAFDRIRGAELLPGPEVATAEQLEAWVIANADTGYHPVGTCRMAPSAEEGVVDMELRVHGVEGLRVVDASVFPRIPNGNTQAATFMVAERAAEFILRAARG